MIQNVSTQHERYLALVNVIGPRHKAGDKGATADLELLEENILKALGIFQAETENRIGTIIDSSDPEPESREARRLRREQEYAARKAESKAAREIVNALSAKYGVEDVFRSDATPEQIAAEIADMAADALTSDHPSGSC